MNHPLPWCAMLRKDGVYVVCDAHGTEVLTFNDDPRCAELADLISSSVNAHGRTWLILKKVEGLIGALGMQARGMTAPAPKENGEAPEEGKAILTSVPDPSKDQPEA